MIRLLFAFLILLNAYLWPMAFADDHMKYCKDARTGEIIVVPSNQPCPYPTHEI